MNPTSRCHPSDSKKNICVSVNKKLLTDTTFFVRIWWNKNEEDLFMVKLRLQRFGTTKRPFYRIVAADSRKPRDGRFLEIIGVYDPTKEPAYVNIDNEKALVWLKKGAQPTETVKSLFSKAGIIRQFVAEKSHK